LNPFFETLSMKIILRTILILMLTFFVLNINQNKAFSQDCGLRENQSARPSQLKERVSNRRYCRKQFQVSVLSRPQINLGYHFNDVVYIGAMMRAAYTSENEENYGIKGMDSDSSEEAEAYRLGTEIRFSPFKLGFYMALGLIFTGEDEIKNSYEKLSQKIGNNTYNTDIDLNIKRKSTFGGAYGLGYIHIFDSGFSLGAGTLWSQTEPDLDIEVTTKDEVILASDLSSLKDNIEKIEKENTVDLFYLSIGYNF
jgi:hypothetical protein